MADPPPTSQSESQQTNKVDQTENPTPKPKDDDNKPKAVAPVERLPIRRLQVKSLVVQDHGQLTQLLVESDAAASPSSSLERSSKPRERAVSPLPIRRLHDYSGGDRPGADPAVIRTYIIGQTHPLARAAIMGAFLDKPQTDKTNHKGEGFNMKYALTAMQGWRVDMEDAHTVCVGLGTDPSSSNAAGGDHASGDDSGHIVHLYGSEHEQHSECPLSHKWAFYAVFDGHAGHKVARHCSKHLWSYIHRIPELHSLIDRYHKGDKSPLTDADCETIKQSIVKAFLQIDDAMRKEFESAAAKKHDPAEMADVERSGTTAVCTFVTHSHYFLINLGDSRGILSRQREEPFATEDHKPFLPRERERIHAAGGSVMIQRVNGSLAVSRALGDFEYKASSNLPPTRQLVSPEPDIYCLPRKEDQDEFILLACDGIFDVMNNGELVDFIRWRLKTTDDLCKITNDIVDACLSKSSRDNMSVILVTFPAAPKFDQKAREELDTLRKKVKDRVHDICAHWKSEEKEAAIDTEAIMRALSNQEHSDLQVPPGAGVHAMHAFISALIEEQKPVQQQQQQAPEQQH